MAAVEYKKPVSKKVTSVTIPDKVTISGKAYKVTGVSANAFSGCKKLKKVTVGKNALKGINAKAVVKVPKKKIVLYKKLLKGKGLEKGMPLHCIF